MPFEPFTRERLSVLLEQHKLTEQGLRFVEAALAAPSRNVQGTTRNVISDVPCPKMWGSIQSESWSVENPFILQRIFDPNVIGYATQVPRIELSYRGRNDKSVRTSYTGDCLTLHASEGVVLEEFKHSTERGQLEENFPGKYYRLESGNYSSDPICNVVNQWGIKFVVVFSDEVTTIAHRNRRFLHGYLQPSAAASYAHSVPRLIETLGDMPCRSYAEMVDLGADRDVLNWAIAHGYLHIDFNFAAIATATAEVLVFRHHETLKAWMAACWPHGGRPSAPNKTAAPRDFQIGDVFVFDGVHLTVTMVGATALHATNEQHQYISIDYLQIALGVRTGKVILPQLAEQKIQRSRIWSVSPSSLDRALRRLHILEKIEHGSPLLPDEHYSASTMRRWRRAIVEGEAQEWSSVESLIDFGDDKGFRGAHIAPEFSELLNGWIRQALEDNKHKSLHANYFDIKKLAETAGHVMVAKSSFYERVIQARTVNSIRKSQGYKVAMPLEPVHWQLQRDTPIHCERAFELVHFDSTLLDVEIRSSLSGDVIGRPWLSIAVCAQTRRVVGMYLSFRPPSYVSTMMLLADIVKRFGRLPEAIIHDWGSEFKAKDWKLALTTLFIVRHVRPKSAPRFGAILERMIGVVTQELINNIAGNTKLRKNVRQLTPQADPTTHSGLWLADLYQGFEEYFFDIYDNRKHPATLRPPREMCEASFASHGVRRHRLRRYDEILPILMPTARGRPRVVDPARGINVNYRFYGHPLLTSLSMSGESTLVKPIPFDPGSVLAFLKGNWVICKAGIHPDLARAPEHIRRCLFEEWLVEQRLVAASNDDSREKLRQLLDRLNAKALENKEYWRDREVRDFMSTATFSSTVADSNDAFALGALEKMMQAAIEKAAMSDAYTATAGER